MGLYLIVRDVDEGCAEALVQLADLGTGLHAQFRIEVRQRFIEEEDCRVADDGATDGYTLALAAGELFRLAIQQLADAEDVRRLFDFLVDLHLGRLAQAEAKGHVVVYAHVGIESVALEHHGDVAVFRRDIVDDAIADLDLAV